MKKKIIIFIIVIAVLFPTAWSMFGPGRIWTKSMADAIADNDLKKVEELAKDNTYINTPGGVIFPLNLLPEWNNETPLEFAISCGNYKAVKILTDNGTVPVNDRVNMVGLVASSGTYSDEMFDTITLLLKNGAKPDGTPEDANVNSALLEIALLDCNKGSEREKLEKKILVMYKFVEKYCTNKAPIHPADRNSALSYACYRGNYRLVKYLLDKKRYYVNLRDEEGHTPLASVFLFNEDEQNLSKDNIVPLVKLLLKHGANKNIADSEGNTPVDYAKRIGMGQALQ